MQDAKLGLVSGFGMINYDRGLGTGAAILGRHEPPRSEKNPVLRTRLPTLPPAARSRVALGLTAAAALGRFELQQCQRLRHGAVSAARGLPALPLARGSTGKSSRGEGELLADTVLHHSNDLFFRERLPWRLGLVKLDCGPTSSRICTATCRTPGECASRARSTAPGRRCSWRLPDKETANMADDRQLREFTCDPKFRKVLVTDGKTARRPGAGEGARRGRRRLIWVGHAEPWKQFPGFDELQKLPQVRSAARRHRLEERARARRRDRRQGRHPGQQRRAPPRATASRNRHGVETARAEMDVNYFGLLRLAQEFGPAMRARGADGRPSAVAWVNLLSIYALANFPPHGTFSASKAAAHSLSQCLRAEMRPAGVRVVNVFPGPIDDEWNQLLPPPKLAPAALAAAIVKALREGVEDVYPGDVAQEWLDALARQSEGPRDGAVP